jgi:hypothetical protein
MSGASAFTGTTEPSRSHKPSHFPQEGRMRVSYGRPLDVVDICNKLSLPD